MNLRKILGLDLNPLSSLKGFNLGTKETELPELYSKGFRQQRELQLPSDFGTAPANFVDKFKYLDAKPTVSIQTIFPS